MKYNLYSVIAFVGALLLLISTFVEGLASFAFLFVMAVMLMSFMVVIFSNKLIAKFVGLILIIISSFSVMGLGNFFSDLLRSLSTSQLTSSIALLIGAILLAFVSQNPVQN